MPFSRCFPLALFLSLAPWANPALHAAPPERATYDVTGRLISLLHAGEKLPVNSELLVHFTGGVTASLQPQNRPPILVRDAGTLRWHGDLGFPNGGTAGANLTWTETTDGTTLDASLRAPSALDTQSVECVFDLPRAEFSGGRLEATLSPAVNLPTTKPEQTTFFNAETNSLVFTDAAGTRTLSLKLDRILLATVTDRWDAAGRSFRVRLTLHKGEWVSGETIPFHAALTLTGPTPTAPAVNLHVDADHPRYGFDGYGGNFCWGDQSALTTFLLDELQPAWTRHELKARDWDRERAHPSPALVHDFERMRTMQDLGIPWILSIWNLPQRFYGDANQHPPDHFFHPIAPDRWDELLDLIGSYLLYLKTNYHAEPDLFSFNESDLGIYVGFTPEAHRDAITRLGAHFAKLGLKTKLLLGDTSDACGTHRFVLPAADDAEAMRYVGALSFHSWRKTTPAQYEAWADVADWLGLPLLVAEAGVDPDAYYNGLFDSYDYGLSEAAQQQEMLRFARPRASIFWQYTSDYGLCHLRSDGTVEPTSRFFLLKHFATLTPRHSQVLPTTSDQGDVLVSAFRRGGTLAIHLLNLGPARAATVHDLPLGQWRVFTTTETADFVEDKLDVQTSTVFSLPARSLVSLVRDAVP